MTNEELMIRILDLEKKLKKANYRLYLLEKGKSLMRMAAQHTLDKSDCFQLTLLDIPEEQSPCTPPTERRLAM
jgi:hypothetical protein